MKLPKFTFASNITILSPRWHDKVVLVAKHKVGRHNIIKIKEGSSWSGEWYADAHTIRKYAAEPMRTKNGGSILLHPVPLDELVLYEGREE